MECMLKKFEEVRSALHTCVHMCCALVMSSLPLVVRVRETNHGVFREIAHSRPHGFTQRPFTQRPCRLL